MFQQELDALDLKIEQYNGFYLMNHYRIRDMMDMIRGIKLFEGICFSSRERIAESEELDKLQKDEDDYLSSLKDQCNELYGYVDYGTDNEQEQLAIITKKMNEISRLPSIDIVNQKELILDPKIRYKK